MITSAIRLFVGLLIGMLLSMPGWAAAPSPVGRVITPKGPVCTGVLVSEYAVLTAAHCLVNRAGDGYFSAGLIHFALYPEGADQLYAKSAERHIAPNYTLPVGTDPDQLTQDWAVLILEEPMGRTIRPAQLVTEDGWNGGKAWTLEVIAFGRARALRPTIRAERCRQLDGGTRQRPALIHHSCLVQPGSSGSVLLGWRNGERHALAVNVAARRGKAPRTTATLLPPDVRALITRTPQRMPAFQSPFQRSGPSPWGRKTHDDRPE